MLETYEKPRIVELGKLDSLTEQHYNKIGPSSDIYTSLTNGAVIGSIVPVP
jgi:hypothetical protein